MVREDGNPAGGSPGSTRRLVLNPTSGRGGHAGEVRRLAAKHGFPVEETERRGHAVELAERAAEDGVDLLAVAGGDGTVHEVVQGLLGSDALDSVTLSIVPAGTENIVARDLGAESLADGFEIAEHGETRRLDLGVANGEPFVMSAIAGLPADASAAATQELKHRFGPLAFLIGAVEAERSFDGLRIAVDTVSGNEAAEWRGEALAVLIGNLRHFAGTGGQANAEDGLLELAIVERMPPGELVAEAIEQRLLGRETPHVTELRADRLSLAGFDEDPVTFSLDGEIREFREVDVGVLARALRLRVGSRYVPDPDDGARPG